uniref:Polycomb protein VEFS-Box domain-containing protein n=1 Tax=Meloidogyne javanica TaxID=6303 RepID=A0A915NEQ2_MELJA
MLNSSDSSSLSSNPLLSTTRSHQNTRSREIGTSGNCNNLRWNVPKMHFSDSSATEDQHGTENSSSDENSLIGPSTHNVDCSSDTTKIQTKDSTIQFALRVLSVYSPCFFCKAKLHLTNLWTLYKHFRFMHPRFTFTYEIRVNDEFPIERFTAIAHAHCNEFEYLLSMGRFVFEVPTKIDQQWLIQSGSRKLEDITDLHPAERIMMQMWNAFLPGIHITMLARKMTYKAARVFVGYHWRQIEQLKLRTHFLLLLSTLLNVNVIDEEERYDLLMRLDPNYVLFDDSRHFVTQELTLLEKERRNNQRAGSIDDESEYYDSKEDVSKLKNSKKESKANDKDKKCFSNYYITQQSLLPSIEFNSLMELRNRYPFASGKRLGNIWKFIRPYDFKDFALQISTASIAKS